LARAKLSIIIPVYNERETFPTLLARVQAVDIDKEIIVVDNCSTDGTRELLGQLSGERLEVVLQPQNLGKGTSVRTGMARARGEYLIVQDADLEYNPQEIRALLEVAEAGAPVVFGSRLLGEKPVVPLSHALGRDFLNLLFRLLYGARLTDVATCYKLIRTDIAQSLTLRSTGFDLDYELPAKLRKAGYPIVEVSVSYRPRTFAEGKKLRWTVGFKALGVLLKYRVVD
jgi:glycosyltransferase involved in cell wall biosynthesis